ncbi:hypothetical protein [Streptomyces olivaceoviridis]|uniref:hypothetical protein n=1 Tax=Streptomyces olivaceoviridis TaxID=1921 RepID=UPI0036F62415
MLDLRVLDLLHRHAERLFVDDGFHVCHLRVERHPLFQGTPVRKGLQATSRTIDVSGIEIADADESENHSTPDVPSAMIGGMFRYAFLVAASAVADAPKAAVPHLVAAVDGARS